MSCNLLLQIPELGTIVTYGLYLGQVFCLGLAYNLSYIILERRTKPEHLAMSIELNISAYMLFATFAPILVKASPPLPVEAITSLCLISIAAAHSIG